MQIQEIATPCATPKTRIEILEAALANAYQERDALCAKHDQLKISHDKLRLELELLKRRLFVAKAERVDTAQLEIEFAATLAELNRVAQTPPDDDSEDTPKKKRKHRSTGRRNLREAVLEEERVELTDVLFEKLVEDGKAERIGFEESCKLAYKRGGMRRLVIARAKYRALNACGTVEIETTPMPAETFARSLAAPSMLARVVTEKHCDGLPLFRIEDRSARDGFRVDRGTMCRWVEDAGATLGATVVAAMRTEAMRTAFCIATDATGVAVQPEPLPDKKRQACRRGHYFVLIADRDHIFFEYTAKETSKVVAEMFKDYTGYILADAKNVYDVLFRPPKDRASDDETELCREVGCWSHCRTKFWEASWTKSAAAREALVRIGRFFEVDAGFRGKPPSQIKQLRNLHLRPHLEAFFGWAEQQYALVRDQRGPLRSAFGYAVRQKAALLRVLEDGRLVLHNNGSENQLRKIAVGRKAWLFVGSDDHAQSAGHLFSAIASARLHGLDPETYLRDIFRVLAHWPNDRYIELAPKYWAATRARLDAHQLSQEVGILDIPPPLSSQEQPAPN